MPMTAKQFRKLRVRAQIQQLHGHQAFDDQVNAVALRWFLRNCQTSDPLAARLSPFAATAKARLQLYPLASKNGGSQKSYGR